LLDDQTITDKIVSEESEIKTESGKTFTQDEVNALVESRLARAKKQMPAKEELDAFKVWKESQKTESEKMAQREQEYQQILTEKETIKRENIVLKNGVNADDADYIIFKVSKFEGDFEDNLKTFLSENPKYTVKPKQNTGVVTTNINRDEDGVLAILRKKYPNLL